MASQFDHLTSDHQHQHMDTDSINNTQSHDITTDHKRDATADSGMDWFHSINPSQSLVITSPTITSTQENFLRKPKSSSSDSSSSFDTSFVERNQNVKGLNSLTSDDMKQSGRQESRKPPESSDCVIQKTSKKLRKRRLGELEVTHDKCDKGEERREVFRDTTSQFVTNDRLKSHSKNTLSSAKKYPSNNQVQDNLSSVKKGLSEIENRRDTEKRDISTVKRKKTEAEDETCKDLHARFSSFIFKPKKMGPLVHNQGLNSSSDIGGEFQKEPNPGNKDLQTNKHNKESRVSHRKEVSCNESASTLKDAEDEDRGKKNQNQCQNRLEGGGVRKQVSCVSEVEEGEPEASFCFTTEVETDVFSCGKNKLSGGKTFKIHGSDNTENQCHQQRTKFNIGMETNVESCMSTPPFNPSLSKPGPSKSVVASSTLDKLSAFSFTGTTEPKTTDQTMAGKNRPIGLERSSFTRNSAGSLRVNSQDNSTLNSPQCSPLRKKIRTEVTLSKIMNISPPPVTEHESEIVSSSQTKSKCITKETEPTHAANHNSVQTVTDNLNKRKCFQLGPQPNNLGGSGGLFSKLSLFGSVEMNDDDVLDTDWDQEVSKKAKD